MCGCTQRGEGLFQWDVPKAPQLRERPNLPPTPHKALPDITTFYNPCWVPHLSLFLQWLADSSPLPTGSGTPDMPTLPRFSVQQGLSCCHAPPCPSPRYSMHSQWGGSRSQSHELTPKPQPHTEWTENHHASETLGGPSLDSAGRSGRSAQCGGCNGMASAVAGRGLAAILTFATDQALQHPPLLL